MFVECESKCDRTTFRTVWVTRAARERHRGAWRGIASATACCPRPPTPHVSSCATPGCVPVDHDAMHATARADEPGTRRRAGPAAPVSAPARGRGQGGAGTGASTLDA